MTLQSGTTSPRLLVLVRRRGRPKARRAYRARSMLVNQNVAIVFVDNGVTKSVGVNATDNIDYQAIQEWVKAGNTIEEAD